MHAPLEDALGAEAGESQSLDLGETSSLGCDLGGEAFGGVVKVGQEEREVVDDDRGVEQGSSELMTFLLFSNVRVSSVYHSTHGADSGGDGQVMLMQVIPARISPGRRSGSPEERENKSPNFWLNGVLEHRERWTVRAG